MLRAIIIDDEDHCIRRLQALLETHCTHLVKLLASCATVADGINSISRYQPDLIFLDIHVGDESGFDVLQRLPESSFDVIFTTAYDKYAIQAIRFSAADYLLKPVLADDLVIAIETVKKKRENAGRHKEFETLIQNLVKPSEKPEKMAVPTLAGLELLVISDIVRCQSNGNYTTIHLRNKNTILVAKTLKDFEIFLSEHGFFRVHNSHLINLATVKKYQKGKGGYVVLEDNTEIEVSSRRKEELLLKISSF